MNGKGKQKPEEELYVSVAPRITKQLADSLDATGIKWRDIPGVGDMYEFFKWDNHETLVEVASILSSDSSAEDKFLAIGKLFRLFKVEPNIGWETHPGVVCIRKSLYLRSDGWQLNITRDVEGENVLAKGYLTVSDYAAVAKYSKDPEWEVFCVFLAEVYAMLSKYEEWGEDGSEFSEYITAAFHNSDYDVFATLDSLMSERDALGLVALYQQSVQEGCAYPSTEEFHGFEENTGTTAAKVVVAGTFEENGNFKRLVTYDADAKYFALHVNSVEADFEKFENAVNPLYLTGRRYNLQKPQVNQEDLEEWQRYARAMGFATILLYLNSSSIRNYPKGFGRNHKHEEHIMKLLQRSFECAVDSKTRELSLGNGKSKGNKYLVALRERIAEPVANLYASAECELKSADDVWKWVQHVVK